MQDWDKRGRGNRDNRGRSMDQNIGKTGRMIHAKGKLLARERRENSFIGKHSECKDFSMPFSLLLFQQHLLHILANVKEEICSTSSVRASRLGGSNAPLDAHTSRAFVREFGEAIVNHMTFL